MRAWVLITGLFFGFLAAPGLCAEARFTEERATVARVFELLDERLAVMPDVAAWKWQNQKPISDPQREQAVVQSAVDQAATLGLSADGVRQLFELQIRLAREVQASLHEEWRRKGFDASRSVPSLDAEIRPKLDQLTPDLLRALYLAAPAFQRSDFAAAYPARGEVTAALAQIKLVPAPALRRIQAAKVIRVGTTGDYAPFTLHTTSTPTGALTGSDIELAESLAQALGVQPVFIRTSWSTLMSDLALSKFDIAVGGVSVTPAREAVAAFSIPYTSGGKTIISRCKDARRFATLKALDKRGTRVVVNPGGTNEQYVRANVHHAEVRVFPDNRAIFEEIRAGRADVMITDDVEVELQTRRHADLCRPFRGTLTHADKAILMPRDASLQNAVNEWLTPWVKADKPAKLIEQFLQPAQ